jgi:hypothetical protein
MDKKSEQRKDAKECGDTDIGVHDYGAGGKREQLSGLWSIPSKEVVGLGPERIMTNCYCKEDDTRGGREKGEKLDLMDAIIEHGPPLLNTSKPRRVF